MPCADPDCSCQPAPKGFLDTQSLKLVLRGPEKGQISLLNLPNAELDVLFDFMHHVMIIKETIKDPVEQGSMHSVAVQFDQRNSQFVNLQATAEGSLLFSFRILDSACAVKGSKLRPREKRRHFVHVESALYNRLVMCDWPQKNLQLFLPASQIKGWKTAALILLTFNRITTDKWRCLVNIRDSYSMAGLDWRQVEMNMKLKEKQAGRYAAKLNQKMPVYKNYAGVISLQKSHEIMGG